MLLAGYPVESVREEERSNQYLEFMLMAWQQEGHRLLSVLKENQQAKVSAYDQLSRISSSPSSQQEENQHERHITEQRNPDHPVHSDLSISDKNLWFVQDHAPELLGQEQHGNTRFHDGIVDSRFVNSKASCDAMRIGSDGPTCNIYSNFDNYKTYHM